MLLPNDIVKYVSTIYSKDIHVYLLNLKSILKNTVKCLNVIWNTLNLCLNGCEFVNYFKDRLLSYNSIELIK